MDDFEHGLERAFSVHIGETNLAEPTLHQGRAAAFGKGRDCGVEVCAAMFDEDVMQAFVVCL